MFNPVLTTYLWKKIGIVYGHGPPWAIPRKWMAYLGAHMACLAGFYDHCHDLTIQIDGKIHGIRVGPILGNPHVWNKKESLQESRITANCNILR